MQIFNLILSSVWFLTPAYISNMLPVFVRKINFLDTPVDFGKNYRKKRIFGKDKTYRGLFFGTLGAIFITYLQVNLYQNNPGLRAYSIINYSEINALLFGFLMGFGALFGDLVKSFFKRRVNIAEGESWFPFDQSDFVLGALFMTSILFIPQIEYIFTMIIISIALHLLSVWIGYFLGIRKA